MDAGEEQLLERSLKGISARHRAPIQEAMDKELREHGVVGLLPRYLKNLDAMQRGKSELDPGINVVLAALSSAERERAAEAKDVEAPFLERLASIDQAVDAIRQLMDVSSYQTVAALIEEFSKMEF